MKVFTKNMVFVGFSSNLYSYKSFKLSGTTSLKTKLHSLWMRDYPHLTYWEVVHSLVHLFWLSICLSYQQRVDIAIQNSIDSYFQNMQTFCLNSTQKTHNRWNYTQEVSPIFIWKNNWTEKRNLRCPGIEPGSTAWKAAMLTTIPTSLVEEITQNFE